MVAFVILTVIPSSIVIWRISKVEKSWIIPWAFLFAVPRLRTYCVHSLDGTAVKPVNAWDQSQCSGIARQALSESWVLSSIIYSTFEYVLIFCPPGRDGDHQSCLEDWETELPGRDTLSCWAVCSSAPGFLLLWAVTHIDSFVMDCLWVISAAVRSPNKIHWFTKLNFGGSLTLVCPKFPIWDK